MKPTWRDRRNLLISIAELVGALSAIIGAVVVVEKWTKGKMTTWLLKPVFDRLDAIDKKIYKMDKEQCMNFLNEFIADLENGVHKNQYQIKRAHDIYNHYEVDLDGNSYIKEQWDRVVLRHKGGEK